MNTYHFHYYKDGYRAGSIETTGSRQQLKRTRRWLAQSFKVTLGRVKKGPRQ